jgi:hypothetical protein
MKPPPIFGRSAEAIRTGAGAGGIADWLGWRTTGSVTNSASFAAACGNPRLNQQALASSAKYILFIDVLILFSSWVRRSGAFCTRSTKSENRIGLVNETMVSIHHVVSLARFCRVAFIFDENLTGMVNRWCAANSRLRILVAA